MAQLSRIQGLGLLLLAIAAYFPLFLHLDSFPILMWDESRFALNALEMSQNGNPLVTYYEGEPDFWNSKPPLTAFLQAICMKLLGYNELAVRLPSALAGLFTLFVLLYFSWKTIPSPPIGFLSVITLFCSAGYIKLHVVRSGDADALLVLGTTLYALIYFSYLEAPTTKRLLLFGGALLFAMYAKGIAALLPVPGLLLYTILAGKTRLAFARSGLYLTAAIVLLLGVAYYLVREILTPGFLEAVSLNEWGGRFLREASTKQAVNLDYGFYWESFWKVPNHPFIVLLPLLAVLGLSSRSKRIRRLTLFSLCFSLSLWALLSFSRTKHFWYDAPVYPFLALLSGCGLWEAYKRGKALLRAPYRQLLAIVLAALLFLPAYLHVLQRVSNRNMITHWEAEGAMMRQIQEQLPHIKRYSVIKKVKHPFHYGQIYFYQHAYQLEYGQDISVKSLPNVREGDTVLSCQREVIDSLKANFHIEPLSGWRDCILARVDTLP